MNNRLIVVAAVALLIPGVFLAPNQVIATPIKTITAEYPVIFDGWTENGGADWPTIRNAASAMMAVNNNLVYTSNRVGGFQWFGNDYIDRSHLVFDLSSLPDEAQVDSAFLSINVVGTFLTDTSTGIYIVQSTDQGTNATAESYGQIGTTEYGHVMVPSIGHYEIYLNQDGINAILKNGYTRFTLRSWHDFNNIVPLTEEGEGLEGDDIYLVSSEENIELAPRLVITYHLPEGEKDKKNCDKEHKNGKEKGNNGKNCRAK